MKFEVLASIGALALALVNASPAAAYSLHHTLPKEDDVILVCTVSETLMAKDCRKAKAEVGRANGMMAAIPPAAALPMADARTTAIQLRAICSSDAVSQLELCSAFLRPGVWMLNDPKNTALPRICVPPGTKFGDARKVYVAYFDSHPAEADMPAVIVVLEAFAGAYRCPRPSGDAPANR